MSVKRKIKNNLEPKVSIVGLLDLDQASAGQKNQKPKERTEKTVLDLDPAEQILFFAEETKKKRQRDEVQSALSKIKQRVHSTLNEYERHEDMKSVSEIDLSDSDTNIESIDDPAQLYEALRNSQQRSKYLQKLSVLIYGFEKKCQNREQLLSSLYDFFSENQGEGGPQRLLNDVEENEFDFNGATSGLQSAMDTAQEAARRLLAIKQEMSKLIAISTSYPDSKKGRKKMETALLKAQDNVNTLSASLAKVQAELKDSTNHVQELQGQLEVRNQECSNLRSDANKNMFLEIAKEKMSKELTVAQEEIKILRVQIQDSKRPKIIDSRKDQIALEDKFAQDLLFEKEKLQNQHKEDLKVAEDGFKEEVDKIKVHYEKQLKKHQDERRLSAQQQNSRRKSSNYNASDRKLLSDSQHQEVGAPLASEIPDQTGEVSSVRQRQSRRHQRLSSAAADFYSPSPGKQTEENSVIASTDPSPTSNSQDHSDSLDDKKKPSSETISDSHTEAESASKQESKKELRNNSAKHSASRHLSEHRNDSPTHTLPSESEDESTASTVKISNATSKHHPETRPSSPQVHLDPSNSDSELGGSTAFRASSWKPRRFSMFGRTNLALLNARNTDRDSNSREGNKSSSKDKDGLSLMITGPKGGGKESVSDAEKELARRKDAATKEFLGHLREEYRSRERKLKQDIKDIKIESHLTITGLQEQLAAIQNEQNDELAPVKEEVDEPVVQVNKQHPTDTNNKHVQLLETEKAELTKALFETQVELKAQQLLIDQLKETVNEQVSRLHDQELLLEEHSKQSNSTFDRTKKQPGETAAADSTAEELSSQSVKLRSNLSSKQTDVSTQHSIPFVPEAQVPSAQKQQSVSSVRSDNSSHGQSQVHLQQKRSIHQHSSNSQPASTLGGDTDKPNTSNTIQSTLPNESAQLAQDHPVMVEWLKTCKGVSMLRDSVINALCQSGQYRSVADDLLALDLPSINSSQDLSSEVHTARAKMSSFLHQLTLSMTKVVAQAAASQSVSPSINEEEIIDKIRKRLSEQDNNKMIETQKSQERMVELSNEVSCLKNELVSLRRSMAYKHTDRNKAIMFTALDLRRNKQTLKLALENNKISSSTYSKVIGVMEDYISIASERFAYLAKRILDLAQTRKLIKDIQLSYNSSPKALVVLKRLGELQEKKRLQFSVKMDQLGVRRLDVSHTLTSMLQHTEKRAGMFLIKPIFTEMKSFGGVYNGQTKIFPLPRPFPTKRSSYLSNPSTTLHPSLGLVNKLIQSGRKRRHTLGDLGNFNTLKHVPASFPTSFQSGSDVEWSVQDSLPANQVGDIVSSLDAHFNPTHPRILELDIQKQSYKRASLGHIYPCSHQTPVHVVQSPVRQTGKMKIPINLKMEFDSLNHDSS